MTAAHVRWATAHDDAALRRLCRRTPMVGPISYCLEREPDFFALTRLQGAAGGRVVVIEDGGEIVAMAMMAPHLAWIGGQAQQVAYLGDLKVDPDHRHSGLAARLVRFLADAVDREGIERSYFVVLAGNPAFARLHTSARHFRMLRSIANFLVPLGAVRSEESDIVISKATPEDIGEMIGLWNRVNGRRTFAPVLDEALFAHWLSGPISLADFRLARRNGSLAGFCATWDASAIKQIRLLRLSMGLLVTTKMYNIAAPILRRPKFPSANEHLRFLYASHLCAESPEVLTSLLNSIHDAHRTDGYLYFDLALDRADPLTSALAHFRSMKVDFEIWEVCTSSETPPLKTDRCAYFDVSFV